MMSENLRQARTIMKEDTPKDSLLTQEAWEASDNSHQVMFVRDKGRMPGLSLSPWKIYPSSGNLTYQYDPQKNRLSHSALVPPRSASVAPRTEGFLPPNTE